MGEIDLRRVAEATAEDIYKKYLTTAVSIEATLRAALPHILDALYDAAQEECGVGDWQCDEAAWLDKKAEELRRG